MGSPTNTFNGGLFPILPNQFTSYLKIPMSNTRITKNVDSDRSSDEDLFCAKCQENFCNKYYLQKHKMEVHQSEFVTDNSTEKLHLLNDLQQKTPMFRPPIFNSLFNASLSNLFLQKSIPQMISNLQSTQSLLSHSTQGGCDFHPNFAQSVKGYTPLTLNSINILTSCQSSFPCTSLTNHEIKIPYASNTNFIERNSFRKTSLDSKSFLSLNLPDSIFRDPSHHMTCTICSQQLTGGESVLLDHLYTHHSSEKSYNPTPTFMTHSTKDSPLSPTKHTESFISPFDAFKTSMAAAKLADRVTCDICHKDLCNKYFLRTHKLKLHGIQTTDYNGRSGSKKEKLGLYEGNSNQLDQLDLRPNTSTPPFQRSSLENFVLKTTSFNNDSHAKPFASEVGCFCPICKRLVPLPYFLPLHMWNVHRVGIGATNSFLPELSSVRPNIDASSLDQSFLPSFQSKINQSLFPIPLGSNGTETSSMGSKWYRKSPNQMKVRCDICDKWICNKYFLRTHKLNKHGLTDCGSNTEVNSDSISRGFFVDSTNTASNLNATMEPLISQKFDNDNSPIDLSGTQNQNQNITKGLFGKLPCYPLLSSSNVRSLLNLPLDFNWARWPHADLPKNPFSTNNNLLSSAALDLSLKPSRVNQSKGPHLKKKDSLYMITAKKIKLKYQKIHLRKILQRIPKERRTTSGNISVIQCDSFDNLGCPLCGKQLHNASRFVQHLTEFHNMVLPGHHTATL